MVVFPAAANKNQPWKKAHKKVAKNPQFEGKFLIYASPTQNNVKEEKSAGGWNFFDFRCKDKSLDPLLLKIPVFFWVVQMHK